MSFVKLSSCMFGPLYKHAKSKMKGSPTDLRYRGSQPPKASPTTSTSTKFYDLIDKEKSKKVKPRKLKDLTLNDPETEEVKLLFKLYLPKRKQFDDISRSLKQLQNNLPILIPHSNETTNVSYPKLNFQLHLFLANIMTNYVTSWYLSKLNTDNFEFIQSIYDVLCVFIKDLSTRCGIMLNSENLLSRIDEWSNLINEHFVELVGDHQNIKIIYDYEKFQATRNVVMSLKTKDQVIQDYLTSKHIIFESEESRRAYFKVLVKQVLNIALVEENGGGLNSVIGTNFVMDIVGNLVLDNVITKLSTTNFIFSVVKKIIDPIKLKLDAKRIQSKPKSISDRIKGIFSMSYQDFGYLMTWNNEGMDTDQNIFHNSIFDLIDTLTGVSKRSPIISTIVSTLKNVILINTGLVTRINRIVKKTFFKELVQSQFLTDENLSDIIGELRLNIFNKAKRQEEAPISIDTLSKDIFDLLTHECLPIPLLNYFKYYEETDEDVVNCIKAMLLIFDYGDFEKGSLNQVLMIKIIDSFVANLYSELL